MNLDHEILLKLPKTTYRGLARELGVSATTIRRHAKKLGVIAAKYEITDEHRHNLSVSGKEVWDNKEDPEIRKENTKINRKDRQRKRRQWRWHNDSNYKTKLSKRHGKRKTEMLIWLMEYKSTLKCINCDEDFIGCLEFHHNDPAQKDFTISRMVMDGWGKERILEEIEKCDILCANCHRKWHWENDIRFKTKRQMLKELQNTNNQRE